MRLMRPLIFALALAGAFFYFTTWRSNSQGGVHAPNWLSHPAEVEITEAAPERIAGRRRAEQYFRLQAEYSVGGERHLAGHGV